MTERPEEQAKMGRKKTGRVAHKVKVYEEGFKQLNILRGYTGEDMVEVLTRAALDLASREIPTHQANWQAPQSGTSPPGDQATDS